VQAGRRAVLRIRSPASATACSIVTSPQGSSSWGAPYRERSRWWDARRLRSETPDANDADVYRCKDQEGWSAAGARETLRADGDMLPQTDYW